MKIIALTVISILSIIACKTDIDPTSIVGKWSPTYITQSRLANGTYEAFHKINTLVALQTYEFTSGGRFFRDGKPGASICRSGNRYEVANNKITFSEKHPDEALVNCIPCDNWAVIDIKNDTLILEECKTVRNKFVRIK